MLIIMLVQVLAAILLLLLGCRCLEHQRFRLYLLLLRKILEKMELSLYADCCAYYSVSHHMRLPPPQQTPDYTAGVPWTA